MTFEALQREAEAATCEASTIDFKGQFDPSAKGDWCELIKDIAAIANSGGGCILFGLDDDGMPTGLDYTEVLRCDPADITNKVHAYTGKHFSDFRLIPVERGGLRFGCLLILGVRVPLVFVSVGTYPVSDNKQKTAFSAGTVYFRHGAKSQPGTSDDLEAFLHREVAAVRELWLGRLRQVVEAPSDAAITLVPSEGVRLDEHAQSGIRLTNDPAAPAYKLADPNLTHPFRQKEVLLHVNAALDGTLRITSHDLLCVRRTHHTDQNPVFSYHGRYSTPTYSQAFVDWLIEQFQADGAFYEKSRSAYRAR